MANTAGSVLVDDTLGAIRVITLAHHARRNALTPDMLRALQQALPNTPASPNQPIRAVIIEGAAGTFSSGFDLTALTDDERARGVDPITPAADAIATCPVPVIAAVDGHCHGGAVELCAACVISIADTDTRFSVPAVRLGLVYPAGGLRRLRHRLGRAAERVLLPGTSFSAHDARTWGLIHDVVDDARTAARVLATAIAGAAPLAVSGTLQALRAIDEGRPADVDAARQAALHSADLLEGIAAAQQKRPPNFGGL
jgi:enoyl-CoA hydratase/carnithine racemase